MVSETNSLKKQICHNFKKQAIVSRATTTNLTRSSLSMPTTLPSKIRSSSRWSQTSTHQRKVWNWLALKLINLLIKGWYRQRTHSNMCKIFRILWRIFSSIKEIIKRKAQGSHPLKRKLRPGIWKATPLFRRRSRICSCQALTFLAREGLRWIILTRVDGRSRLHQVLNNMLT